MKTKGPRLSTWAREIWTLWVRPASRGLRRSPVVSGTIIATLALCIGVNTAILSVVDYVFLRPLPYPDQHRLALVASTTESGGSRQIRTAQNGLTWETLTQNLPSFELAAYAPWSKGVNLVTGESLSFVKQQRVSWQYFSTLGIEPILGRNFAAEEDLRGGPDVAILSHDLWRRIFQANREAIGQSIILRGEPHTVVGVMPASFRGPVEADVWTTLRPSASAEGGGSNYEILIRLPQSVSWSDAQSEILRLGEQVPMRAQDDTQIELGLVSLRQGRTHEIREPLKILLVAAMFVLAIGCLNVAALLLVQFKQRAPEQATRMALGASRWNLGRDLFAEQLSIVFISGALGALIGGSGLQYFKRTGLGPRVLLEQIHFDSRFLLATFSLSALSLLLVSLGPTLRASRPKLSAFFADRTPGITSSIGGNKHRYWIVAGEVALAFALLVGAGLLLRTVNHLSDLEPGFDPTDVYAATVSLEESRYSSSQRVNQLFSRSLDILRSDPEIETASVALGAPFERWLNLDVRRLDKPDQKELSDLIYITPGYFETLDIPILAGREFDDSDNLESIPVVIVSRSFVERYFKDHDPLGVTIEVSGKQRRIVGVVGDVQRIPGWGRQDPLATMPSAFIPSRQVPDGFYDLVHRWFSPVWIIRTQAPAPQIFSKVQSAINSVDTQLPVGDTRSLNNASLEALSWQRFMATLASTFAAMALLLIIVGLHGLVAQGVLERTHELGIRLALGANRQSAVFEIARPVITSVAAGIAAGYLVTRLSNRWLEHIVWGIPIGDPWILFGTTTVFLLIVVGATVVSALKIARLQPAIILRDQAN